MKFQPVEKQRQAPACWTRCGLGRCSGAITWRCDGCIHYQVQLSAEKWYKRWGGPEKTT